MKEDEVSERKLTVEIVVDQDSKDWLWLFDAMKSKDSAVNGILVRGIANEWASRECSDALMGVHNWLVEKDESIY